jgi:hypothetical protein
LTPRYFCNDLQGKHIPLCNGRTNNQHDLTCNYGKPPCSPSAPASVSLPALVTFLGQHIEYGNGHGVRMTPCFDAPTTTEKLKRCIYRDVNRIDSTTCTANRGATTVAYAQYNQHWRGDTGDCSQLPHVLLLQHCHRHFWRCLRHGGIRNLDQQVDYTRLTGRSNGWFLHLGTVSKLMLGCFCPRMQCRSRKNNRVLLRVTACC